MSKPDAPSLPDAARAALSGGVWKTLAELADDLAEHVPADRSRAAADRLERAGYAVPSANAPRTAHGRRRVVQEALQKLAAAGKVETEGKGDDRRYRLPERAFKARPKPTRRLVELEELTFDPRLQSRTGKLFHEDTAAAYALAMREYDGDEAAAGFPPLDVVFDGETRWVFDGFNRGEAFRRANVSPVWVLEFPGDFDDARYWSLASNGKNGKQRTDDDARKALATLLDSPDLLERCRQEAKAADGMVRTLARTAGVSLGMVTKTLELRGLHIDRASGRVEKKPREHKPATRAELNGKHDGPAPNARSEPAPEEQPRLSVYVSPDPDEDEPADAPAVLPLLSPGAKLLLASGPAFDRFDELLRQAESLVPEMVGGLLARATLYDVPLVEEHKGRPAMRLLTLLRKVVAARKPVAVCAGCGGRGCRACGNLCVLPADRSVVERSDLTPTLLDRKVFDFD